MSDTTDTHDDQVTVISQADLAAMLSEMLGSADLGTYMGGDTLSIDEAARALNEANGIGTNNRWGMRATNMAIAAALPERFRTREIINVLDIRGVLTAISQRTDGAVLDFELPGEYRSTGGAVYIDSNGYKIKPMVAATGNEPVNVARVRVDALMNHVQFLTEEYQNALRDSSMGVLSEADRNRLLEVAARIPSGFDLIPTLQEDLVAAAQGQAPVSVATGSGPTKDDIYAMMHGQWWDGIADTAQEAVFTLIDQEKASGQFISTPVDFQRTSPWQTQSAYTPKGLTQASSDNNTSLYGAYTYIFEQTPEGVAILQRNMREAGIYDKIGMPIGDLGDKTDPATLKAWSYVLLESHRKQQKAMQFLTEQGKEYWQTKQPEQFAQGSQSMLVDQFAESIIGRRLSEQEKAMLAGYVMRMDRQGKTSEASYDERAQYDMPVSAIDVANFAYDEMEQTVTENQAGATNPVISFLNGVR